MKKFVVMLMVLCMTVSMMACGNAENSGGERDTSVTESEMIAENDNQTAETSNDEDTRGVASQGDMSKAEDSENGTTEFHLEAEAEYAELTVSEGFMFESNGDGTCALVEIGECEDSQIVIPTTAPNGDMVTLIKEYAFYDAEDIDTIIFAGLTMELEAKAIQSCEVKKIVITGCDLTIGESAFAYCEDIEELYISNSVIDMEAYAFYDSGKDMGVTLVNCTGVLDDKAFQSCAALNLTISESDLELGENAFSYCEDIENISFDESSVLVDTYAFYDAGDDTQVTFANCEVEIEDKAFQSSGIAALNIANSDTIMGDNAFSYCEDLTDVTIGANNVEIGEYAFYDCASLVNVSIAAESEDDNLNIIIGDNAFQTSSVQNVVVGRGNVEVEDGAFEYCEELLKVEFKGSSLKVGNYAFYGCPATLEITYNGKTYNKESIEEVK